MPPEIVVGSPSTLAMRLAAVVLDDGARAVSARGGFAIALPGGSVATTFFPGLARLAFDWTRTDFFWGDERAVPPQHPDSNYGLARPLWLDPAGVPAERIHRMRAEAMDLDTAARDYEGELRRALGPGRGLDLVLLGVGEDGHVCSLFPGHAALGETQRAALAIEDAPKPPPRRLTLTLPVLFAAERVVVAAAGRGKARALREALDDPESTLPIARVARHARNVVFLLDPEAAGPR